MSTTRPVSVMSYHDRYVGPRTAKAYTTVYYTALILRGRVDQVWNGQPDRFEPDDVIVGVPPVHHSWRIPLARNRARHAVFEIIYHLFVPPAEWRSKFDELPQRLPGYTRLSFRRSPLLSPIRRAMFRTYAVANGTLSNRVSLALNGIEEVLLYCHTHLARDDRLVDPRVRQAVDILSTHFSEPIDLDTLAATCHSSRSHLVSLFHQQVGVPPMRFRERQRVRRARELLRMTPYRIREVAAEVGFSDPLYFSTFFKRHTGLSPRQFRKQGGEKADPPLSGDG